MLLAHKIELDPNNEQRTYFKKASGVARKAYNWALEEWKGRYEAGEKLNEAALRRQLNRIKGEQFPYMLEVTKAAPQESIKQLGSVGVDLGVKALAVLSDGRRIAGPKAHGNLLKKLRKLNKALARSKRYKDVEDRWRDSQNRKKVKIKLAKLHGRIANIRKDALHKATTHIVLNNDIIGIENLHVSGMVKNRRLARSIMDQSFCEFRRQLQYKADMYGAQVFVADRWFPSSKMCSRCREIKETLTLEQRVFECECGNKMDRDLNAAINLRTFAASSAEKQNACGDNSAGAASAA
jgi:putative transposase